MKKTIISNSKEETKSIGKLLASFLSVGDIVLLEGDLGAGKTTFTSGVGEGLNVNDRVISPTFNILKCYFKGRIPMYHIDAYRLENQNIELGLEEYIEGDGVCLIEWPIYIAPLIPSSNLKVIIHNLGEDKRELTFIGEGDHYQKIIESL